LITSYLMLKGGGGGAHRISMDTPLVFINRTSLRIPVDNLR